MPPTKVTGAQVADSTLTNQDIADNAAISGEKIIPSFGTRSIKTEAGVEAGTLKVTDGASKNGIMTSVDDTGQATWTSMDIVVNSLVVGEDGNMILDSEGNIVSTTF